MSYSVHSTKLARFTAMEKQHLQFVQEIAAEEHWDVLLEDLELVYTEYGEFMIVALNEQDQVLGHIFAKSVSQKKVVIDLVLVHKDCRNKGIGTKLMQHAMDCYKGYTFNLVSVEDKNGFYEKFGFKVTGHKLYRAKTHPLSNKAVRVNAPTNLHRVKDVDDKISAKVISFGTSIFGQDTSSLLKCMHRSESNKWLSVTDGDDVEGFLVYKQVKKTCRICVFGAKSLEIAKLLLQETIQRAPAESKYRIGFSLTNKVLYSEVYSRLLQNGVVWDTTEDILSTGECIEDPENWPMMFGIFHYCFIKSHLL